jgi:TolB protein
MIVGHALVSESTNSVPGHGFEEGTSHTTCFLGAVRSGLKPGTDTDRDHALSPLFWRQASPERVRAPAVETEMRRAGSEDEPSGCSAMNKQALDRVVGLSPVCITGVDRIKDSLIICEEGKERRCMKHAALVLGIGLATVCWSFRVVAQDYITPICTAQYSQTNPVMSGQYIVWEDPRGGPTQLYLYNLSDSTTRPLSPGPGEQLSPAIYGSKVVWQDHRNGNWDIYMYDISTGKETPLCTNTANQVMPAIYGDTVVWEDSRNGPWNEDIYMLDLTSMTETPVCTNSSDQMNPAIWRYAVVWEDYRSGLPNIYMYNLATHEESPVSTYSSSQTHPTIWNRRVFWEDSRNSTQDIYMCYLKYWSNGDNLIDWPFSAILDVQLPARANQKSPKAMGDQVTFVDDRSGHWDVYLYSFFNTLWGDLLQITSTTKKEEAPFTCGNHVVWNTDTSSSPYIKAGCDIYMWTRPPGADLAISMHSDPEPVRVGSSVTYAINVLNHGPGPCLGVTVTDSLPTGLMLVSAATTQGGWSMANEIVTFTLGALDSGASALLTITAKAYSEGRAYNYARVSGAATDNLMRNNVAGVWTTMKMFMTVPLEAGLSSSLVLDKLGYPHVNYITTMGNLKIADNVSGAWASHTIDSSGVATETAMCMDSLGNFHVCSIGRAAVGTGTEFFICYRNNSGGWWGPVDTVVTNTDGCSSLSVACDRFGKIHIGYLKAYGGSAPGAVQHVTNASGKWVDETAYNNGYAHAAMAIDTSGMAHFVFYNLAQQGGLLYTTNAPSGTWQTPEKVDQNWSGGQEEMIINDITIDRFNHPHVSFISGEGAQREDTRYATKSGGGWTLSLVDNGSFQSGGNYLSVDQNGSAYLCYYHFTQYPNGQLRYATNSSGSWIHGLIDEGPLMFHVNDDIATDAQGKMHVTFSHSGTLMYATNAEYTPGHGGGDNTSGGYFFANSMANDAPSHPTYEWIDPVANSHFEVTTWDSGDGDNGFSGMRSIGFGFPFFSNTYVGLFIGSNGYISFRSGYLETAAFVTIPSPDPPDNFIAGCAMDLDLRTSVYPDAHVYYALQGNHYVVTYLHAHAKGSATDYITFQIILYPTGDIKIQYNNLESTIPLPNSIGNDALVGIEGVYGVEGLMYRNNGAGGPLFGSPLAVAFGKNATLLPVRQDREPALPSCFLLGQNYPNPFNPTTVVSYQLPAVSEVRLVVYDLLGREVAVLVNERKSAGVYEIKFDGSRLSSGVYFYRLQARQIEGGGAREFTQTKRMLLLK